MNRSLVTVLTDCHMLAFSALYAEERARKIAAKARLAAVMVAVDVLASEPDHSDYVPQGVRPW